jgi:hypothetical protein
MKIYCISGLGADKRIFDFLNLEHYLIHLNWITPTQNESISSYCKRLGAKINQDEVYGFIGVSFGGMIAVELNKIFKPAFTILVSSVEVREELPLLYRIIGKLGLTKTIPLRFYNSLLLSSVPLFKTQHEDLLKNILKDSDSITNKWAINKIVNWSNTKRIKNRLKISGSKDYILPTSKNKDVIEIINGGHLMIVDLSNEISSIINDWIRKKSIEAK